MEINDLFEDAQNYTNRLLHRYRFESHEISDRWFHVNSEWSVSRRRILKAKTLIEKLQELLDVSATEEEVFLMQGYLDAFSRAYHLHDQAYDQADFFISQHLRHGLWVLGYAKKRNPNFLKENPWWRNHVERSRAVGVALRKTLLASDPDGARKALLNELRLMNHDLARATDLLGISQGEPTGEDFLPRAKLDNLLDELEVTFLFFEKDRL